MALRWMPFPRVAAYVGKLQPPSNMEQPAAPARHVACIRRVAQAVNATAANSPIEMVCLPRALAAWKMLARRGIASRLHFGKPLKPEGGNGQTHAWLSSAGEEVTGYPIAYQCVELGYFARAPEGHGHG